MAYCDHYINGKLACVSATTPFRHESMLIFHRTLASSIYSESIIQLKERFHKSQEVVTLGLSLFVFGLAVGPMVLGPLSEVGTFHHLAKCILTKSQFYGRRPIYIISVFFFIMFLIPEAAAQNIQTIIVGRFLDGISGSAFLSVAAGTVADLFEPSQIQRPMMLYTLAPFLGPVLGPLVGGFINSFTTW